MNQRKEKQAENHIKTIHSQMYSITDMKEFMAMHKSIVRGSKASIKNHEKQIKKKKDDIKHHGRMEKAYKKAITARRIK